MVKKFADVEIRAMKLSLDSVCDVDCQSADTLSWLASGHGRTDLQPH